VRAEPQAVSVQQAAPRATAQSMTRAAPQTNPEDLFPDFSTEDQFEIPAFLRRQTN
jgi:hypothetical protein